MQQFHSVSESGSGLVGVNARLDLKLFRDYIWLYFTLEMKDFGFKSNLSSKMPLRSRISHLIWRNTCSWGVLSCIFAFGSRIPPPQQLFNIPSAHGQMFALCSPGIFLLLKMSSLLFLLFYQAGFWRWLSLCPFWGIFCLSLARSGQYFYSVLNFISSCPLSFFNLTVFWTQLAAFLSVFFFCPIYITFLLFRHSAN